MNPNFLIVLPILGGVAVLSACGESSSTNASAPTNLAATEQADFPAQSVKLAGAQPGEARMLPAAATRSGCTAIRFAAGSTSAVVTGSVPPEDPRDSDPEPACYTLAVGEGQNAKIRLLSGKNVGITIPGVGDMSDSFDFTTRRGVYELQLFQLFPSGQAAPFRMQVEVSALSKTSQTTSGMQRAAAPVGTKFQPVSVTILGKTFRLVPVQMEAPSRPWPEVSRHMPAELKVNPRRRLSDEEILQRVEQLRQARAAQIERDLDAITDRHLAQFKRTEPEANRDWFNLELAGACYEGESMGYIPPATLKACGEYLAAEALGEMLRHALGKPSDYY